MSKEVLSIEKVGDSKIDVYVKWKRTVNMPELKSEATEILKTNVSFSFRYWTNLDQKQQGPSDIMGRIFETVANSAERNISRNIPRILNRL